MNILKPILNFFLSIRTALWLLLSLLCLLLYGSLVMPGNEAFEAINFIPLFVWLRQNPASITWWLWCSVAALSLLAANTIVCSFESFFKKYKGKEARQSLLLTLSPQVIHIGFMFILLAHLMSAIGGMKATASASEGSRLGLPDGDILSVKSIEVSLSPEGYATDWRAEIEYISGAKSKRDFLGPNRPSFYKGLGVYLKDVRPYPVKSVVLEVSREPGAPWALIGGILFMAGTLTLIALKIRKES